MENDPTVNLRRTALILAAQECTQSPMDTLKKYKLINGHQKKKGNQQRAGVRKRGSQLENREGQKEAHGADEGRLEV